MGETYLLIAQVKELVKLDTTVRERAERPLLLEVGGDLGVGNGGISLASARPFSIPPPHTQRTRASAALTILRLSLGVLRWDSRDGSCAAFGRSLKRGWLGACIEAWECSYTVSQPPTRARRVLSRSRAKTQVSHRPRIESTGLPSWIKRYVVLSSGALAGSSLTLCALCAT